MEIIVYNPCPVRVLLSSILNHHKRDARAEYFSSYFHIAENTALVTERLLKLMTEINIGGKQVHDANIVATMLVYGIPRLLTHNIGDFARFSELITILPLEN